MARAVRAAGSGPRPEPAAEPRGALRVAWGVLAALVVFSYWKVVPLGFSHDDFLILEAVALRPVTRMVAWSHMIAGWWRPWARELHFWALHRLFGVHAAAFHAANLLLWLGVLAGLLLLVRRLTDARTAVLVAAGACAGAAWGVYLAWACCSQDLWMLLFGEVFLLAQLAHRRAIAPVALALALLSKETAVLMVPIGAWMQLTLRGRAALRARDWAAPLLVVAAWALLHPSLGGRWLFHTGSRFEASLADHPLAGSPRMLLAPLNLEWWPRPRSGWPAALLASIVWAAALGVRGVARRRRLAGAASAHSRGPDRARGRASTSVRGHAGERMGDRAVPAGGERADGTDPRPAAGAPPGAATPRADLRRRRAERHRPAHGTSLLGRGARLVPRHDRRDGGAHELLGAHAAGLRGPGLLLRARPRAAPVAGRDGCAPGAGFAASEPRVERHRGEGGRGARGGG